MMESSNGLKEKYSNITKGTKSKCDHYGFQRGENFDFLQYEQFQSEYLAVLAHRAKRWTTTNTDSVIKMNQAKLKRFCRKGIPSSLREKVWMEVSGAGARMKSNSGVYEGLLSKECAGQQETEMVSQISIDLERTFPDNINFNGKSDEDMKISLKNVLKGFGLSNPDVGYCQGINYVAALLLLIVKDEEKTFWLLNVLITTILPPYYNSAMSGARAEMEVLTELITERYPEVQSKMEEENIPWSLITSKWFICLYVDVLPIETVLRVWDSLFVEGSKILIRVALHIINVKTPHLKVCKGMQETIEAFKNLKADKNCLECHTFMQQCFKETNPLPIRRVKILRMKYLAVVMAEDAELEEKRRRLKNN